AQRERLISRLEAAGIGTLIHYPTPPHLQPAYVELAWRPGSFPISEAIHREALSLPLWPQMSDAQADFVIAGVRSALKCRCSAPRLPLAWRPWFAWQLG